MKATPKKVFLPMLLLLLFCTITGMAQQVLNFKGSIKDENGAALPSVTVTLIQNGKNIRSVTSNTDGSYVFTEIPSGTYEIKFSSVGYKSVTLPASNATQVQLEPEASNLDQVVVVGYTSQKKKDILGSIATVSEKELNQRVASNPATLIQGKLPGIQVTQASGQPGGENVQLRVRGVGTFSSAGNDPLVIIDGLPGSMNNLNPNDIETISVLKDASAAAIYGSRGANGVIVVTTKKGKAGKLVIEYNFNVGFSNPLKLPKTINDPLTFMNLSNQARINSGLVPIYTQQALGFDPIALYKNGTDPITKYAGYDWLDALFKTAVVQNHYLNFRGGNEKTTFTVGAGYSNQPGTMIGFNYKKYTVSLDLNSKINKRITFGTSIQGKFDVSNQPPQGAGDQFLSTLAQSPLYPAQVDGKWISSAFANESHNKNSIAIANELNRKQNNYYLQGNAFVKVNILEGLDFETRAGGNFNNTAVNDFRPTIPVYLLSNLNTPSGNLDVGQAGSLGVENNTNIFTSIYSQLTYNKSFGKHNIALLGGYQNQKNTYSYLKAGRINYPTNDLRELAAGPILGQTNDGSSYDWAINSLYGTANYNYNEKYLLGLSYRRDGTSRLPSNTRWGNYSSVSVGWRISKEDFMKNLTWLNDFKFRGSFGTVGNQNITGSDNQPYPYQSVLSLNNYGFSSGIATGYSPLAVVDPKLTWESTQTLDIGADFALLNNRLTGSFDWYTKETYNILRTAQVGSFTGVQAPIINDGRMQNRGYEFVLNWQDKIGDDFNYNIGGNIQGFTNKLLSFGATQISGNKIYQVGLPYGSYYLYTFDGIFQNQADIASYPTQPGAARSPGDIKLKDINGDGKVNDADRSVISGINPKYQFSINLGAEWKNFDFSAQIYSSQGGKIFVTGWGVEPFRQGSRPTTDWLNAWTPENKSNTYPRIYTADNPLPGLNADSNPSTYFLKDASFIRLRGAQLGYTFPSKMMEKVGISKLRVFIVGDNLFTITKYPGLDPERLGDGLYVTYPQVRTYSFGASIQF